MLYAAYGSNLHVLRLRDRIPPARFVGTGLLTDWSLHFHKRSMDGSAKCNIEPRGPGVYLAIYEIELTCKQKLDAIEGVGCGYSCESIDLPGFGQCFAYRASNSHIDHSLQPYDWYRELVLLGCEARDFPEHYTSRVRSTGSIPDPDCDRRQANWKMVEAMKNGNGKRARKLRF
jgi:hypothetical protein